MRCLLMLKLMLKIRLKLMLKIPQKMSIKINQINNVVLALAHSDLELKQLIQSRLKPLQQMAKVTI